MIGIVDYGLGNLGSIVSMLNEIGAESRLLTRPDQLAEADKLILSGVGAFDEGMRQLAVRELIPALRQRALVDRVPVLGICLGMQLMGSHSEEGDCEGLGWLDARSRRLEPSEGARVPHMGWNYVRICHPDPLCRRLDENSRFYFVHSYHLVCADPADALMTCHHGREFVCAFQRDNLYGVQFHPEKSHRFGMRLLQNFHEL